MADGVARAGIGWILARGGAPRVRARFLLARLREHGWNISRTAEAIGLARESLSRKMRALKIQVPRGE